MGYRQPLYLVTFTLLTLAACGDDGGGNGGADAGSGPDSGSTAGETDGGESTAECGAVTAILRDFRADHPDMEIGEGSRLGLVETMLGADGKPVYAPDGPTEVTAGADSFNQWYRDIEGINMRFEQELVLEEVSDGVFVFEDSEFFPLDGLGFPNEELMGHNFHFTTEINGTFKYNGGEVFTFRGDDDVFVFVNERLALDLGGVHAALEGTIDFDARADELGIEIGETYRLDVFHAERHVTQSNFRIETSIECLGVIIE